MTFAAGEAVAEATKTTVLGELCSAICSALGGPAPAASRPRRITGQGFQRLDVLISSIHGSLAAQPGLQDVFLDKLARPATSILLESENRESIPETAVLLASLIRKCGDKGQRGSILLFLHHAQAHSWTMG